MRKSFLCTIVLAAAGLLLCAQEARAQYAYGSSGIGYDPNTKIVYGYSRTSVDYYAGSYYDPYVEGFLLDPYSYRDWGYSRGYMYYYSALVETATYTSPSTRYDVESDHYVISWYSVTVTVCDYYGFYGGCGYDPYGFSNYFGGGYGGFNYFYGGYGGYVPERTYYLGTTGIAGITPQPDDCEGESSQPYAMSAEGSGEPAASSSSTSASNYEATSSTSRDYVALSSGSSCALLPKVSVKSVGFKNDLEVRKFVNGDANDPVIAPGNEPTWVKGRSGNGDNVVAYIKGQAPTIFATLTVSGADPNASATLRVRRGETVYATMPIDVSANQDVSFDNIALPAQLGETVGAREKSYEFKWEVTFNGRDWKSAGTSGDHKIYWTLGAPTATAAEPIFRNVVRTGYAGLYDIALERSIGKLDGTNDPTEAIRKISNGVATDLIYNPGRKSDLTAGGKHPLEVYKRDRKDFQCDDNAFLLRGLLRSAGLDGTVEYYWGGQDSKTPSADRAHFYIQPGGQPGSHPDESPFPTGETVTARFDRPALLDDNVADKPHFSYHATVTAAGASYDPSYGSRAGDNSQPVKILQAVSSSGQCVNGSAADTSWKVITDRRPGSSNGTPFGRACGSVATGGGTGIPRSASVVSQSVPTFMEAGAAMPVSITLQNNGDNTWTDADLYRLGAQNPQDNWTWGINRTGLPRSVAPGEQVTVDFYAYAPSTTGYYNFQWRMVQDGVEWFGDYTPNILVEVYSLYTCDPWQEQDCWNRGGYWDSTSCYCSGGYYYY